MNLNRSATVVVLLSVLAWSSTLTACNMRSVASSAKVAGGELNSSDYPFTVLLMMTAKAPLTDASQIVDYCTGSIVSDRLVLTAAHCFKQFNATYAFIADGTGDVTSAGNIVSVDYNVFPGYQLGNPSTASWLDFASTLATDVAFAIYPANTFDASKIPFGEISDAQNGDSAAAVGDAVNLVGYGATDLDSKINLSNRAHKRYLGANTIAVVEPTLASAIELLATKISRTSALTGGGDSGGPLIEVSTKKIVGICHNGGRSQLSDGSLAYTSLFINLNDVNVNKYVHEMLEEASPHAGTAQQGVQATTITATPPASTADAMIDGSTLKFAQVLALPECTAQGGSGYGPVKVGLFSVASATPDGTGRGSAHLCKVNN